MKRIIGTALMILALFLTIQAQTGKVLKSFNTQGKLPTGLCYDGQNLWQTDQESDKIYCLNAETGEVIKSIESPAYWPVGLA